MARWSRRGQGGGCLFVCLFLRSFWHVSQFHQSAYTCVFKDTIIYFLALVLLQKEALALNWDPESLFFGDSILLCHLGFSHLDVMLVECYDPKGDQWNILQTPILEGRSGPGCAVLDDSIYLVGGYSWSMVSVHIHLLLFICASFLFLSKCVTTHTSTF